MSVPIRPAAVPEVRRTSSLPQSRNLAALMRHKTLSERQAERWEEINTLVRERGAWITSVPYDVLGAGAIGERLLPFTEVLVENGTNNKITH